jgi:DNA topoisomerase I
MKLSEDAEEIAGFYARMLEHDYITDPKKAKLFNENFFRDWRKSMSKKEREVITDLKRCNFKYMNAFFQEQSEKNRNRTKEEKLALKEKNEAMMKEYGFAIIDGHKEKIGNFKIEPPGLFRGIQIHYNILIN